MKPLDRVLLFALALNAGCARQPDFDVHYTAGETGIRGTVLDAKTSERLSGRIVLRDSARVQSSYYKIYPGHFTAEDGTFFLKAEPGSYWLEIYHGIDYCSHKRNVEIRADQTLEISARLEPWVPLHQLGWVNGDGHAHLYTDVKRNEQMLTTVRQICCAQGVDFISTNQGWAGYGDDDWQSGYAPFSDDRFQLTYGLYRVYYQVGDDRSLKNIAEAVRKGRTFVTAGPIVFASIDGHYQVGDDLPADGSERVLSIDAYASGDTDEYLSYIIIFRNGKICKLWDVRAERPRHVEKSLTIAEEERAWYVIKVYGARAHDPEHLDVLSVCEQIADGSFTSSLDSEAAICLTSPFYFWPEQKRDPAPLVADVELTLIDPKSGDVIDEAAIFVLQHGDTLASVDVAGRATFKMPIDGLLRIEAPGFPVLHRGLYLDYEPHLKLIESFANGDWLDHHGWRHILAPGQVPWQAFQYEKTREVLSSVNWTIAMRANERDSLWEDFAALFERSK